MCYHSITITYRTLTPFCSTNIESKIIGVFSILYILVLSSFNLCFFLVTFCRCQLCGISLPVVGNSSHAGDTASRSLIKNTGLTPSDYCHSSILLNIVNTYSLFISIYSLLLMKCSVCPSSKETPVDMTFDYIL